LTAINARRPVVLYDGCGDHVELVEQLRAEHDLIEQVAGSLRTYVRARARGESDPADGPRFMAFFRRYAGDFHHGREEDTLFVALQREAELPGDRGPIAVLLDDHHRMAGLLDEMEPLMARATLDEASRARLQSLGLEYSRQLWQHIDAENSVLLPESEHRLRRHSVLELPSREMRLEESEAREAGVALVARYPPVHEPDVMRGDGCVFCPAFYDTCRGVEHEWWNEWEWDEFEDHLPSG
jgi:hemerythrin-like domain-containing protein